MEVRTLMLLVANLNAPIQIKEFLIVSSKGNAKLDRSFLLIWTLSGFESCVRLIVTSYLSSEEIFYKMFSPFNVQSYIFMIILMEYMIFMLWYLFFNKIYIWSDLINSNHDRVRKKLSEETSIQTESYATVKNNKDIIGTMEMELAAIEYTSEKDNEIFIKVKRSQSFVHMNDRYSFKAPPVLRRNSCPLFKATLHQATTDFTITECLKYLKDLEIEEAHLSNSNPTIVRRKIQYFDKRMILNVLTGIGFLSLCALFSISFSMHTLIPNESIYKDCFEVQQHNKPDGLYLLNLTEEPTFSYCRNGSTLIQKRTPFMGNSRNYFERGYNEYGTV